MNENAVLCFVNEPWAYFTTRPLPTQWGDDWNDAPYDCNAGAPYTGEGWEVFRVAYDGNFREPCSGCHECLYSVQDINRGAAPWLVGIGPGETPDRALVTPIYAGTTYSEFVQLVLQAGGKIYVPLTSAHNTERPRIFL